WPYGYSMPIAVRYTQDAFSRSGWLWPVDAKGEPLKATSYMAVGFYVAKYVNKKSDMDLAAKGLGAKEWNNSLKTKLSLLPKKLFRIRMSRNFGMKNARRCVEACVYGTLDFVGYPRFPAPVEFIAAVIA